MNSAVNCFLETSCMLGLGLLFTLNTPSWWSHLVVWLDVDLRFRWFLVFFIVDVWLKRKRAGTTLAALSRASKVITQAATTMNPMRFYRITWGSRFNEIDVTRWSSVLNHSCFQYLNFVPRFSFLSFFFFNFYSCSRLKIYLSSFVFFQNKLLFNLHYILQCNFYINIIWPQAYFIKLHTHSEHANAGRKDFLHYYTRYYECIIICLRYINNNLLVTALIWK